MIPAETAPAILEIGLILLLAGVPVAKVLPTWLLARLAPRHVRAAPARARPGPVGGVQLRDRVGRARARLIPATLDAAVLAAVVLAIAFSTLAVRLAGSTPRA